MTDSIIPRVGHDRFDVAVGLRALADLVEGFPNLPVPTSVRAQVSVNEGDEAARIAEVERAARLVGVAASRNPYGISAEVHFVGDVSLTFFALTDDGRARHGAESSYRGAVTP